MAKSMASVYAPRETAKSPEAILEEKRELAQVIEASQGGRYAGSPWAQKWEDPPVRPVRGRRG